ncbi:MAG: endonuclease domain-containing protein [Elusimicrobiota bacterium]
MDIHFARQLRKDQTKAESVLWYQLRSRRFFGYKFKRQVPLGPYIVDFYCYELKLVIEVDGGHHDESRFYDEIRSRYLNTQGLTVIRFWNNEVLSQIEAVLEKMRMGVPGPHPNPLPQAGEGKRD